MIGVKVLDRQNLIDLAVQYYGSPAAAKYICIDNNLELDDDLSAGDTILIRETYPDTADKEFANYIKANNIIVVSFNEQDGEVLGTNDNEYIITNDNNEIGA